MYVKNDKIRVDVSHSLYPLRKRVVVSKKHYANAASVAGERKFCWNFNEVFFEIGFLVD